MDAVDLEDVLHIGLGLCKLQGHVGGIHYCLRPIAVLVAFGEGNLPLPRLANSNSFDGLRSGALRRWFGRRL